MNICLGWMCDLAPTCAKYQHNEEHKATGTYIHYFLPIDKGEHCEHWECLDYDNIKRP